MYNIYIYYIYIIIFRILRTALKHGLFYINSSTQRTTLWFANLSQAAVSPKNLPDNPPPPIHRRPHLAGAAPKICAPSPDGGFNSKSQMERCQIGGLVELIFRLKLENLELKHVRRSEDCHSFWDKPWWQLKLCTTCPIIHGCLFLFNNACFCIASRYSIAISWKGSWILCYHDIVTTKRKKGKNMDHLGVAPQDALVTRITLHV